MDRSLYNSIMSLLNDDPSSINTAHLEHPTISRETVVAMYHRKSRNTSKTNGLLIAHAGYPKDHFYVCYKSRLLEELARQSECMYEYHVAQKSAISTLCKEYCMMPCLMARLIIKSVCVVFGLQINGTTVLKNPESILEYLDCCVNVLDKMALTHLCNEFIWCVVNDPVNAPNMDAYRHEIGHACEVLLERYLSTNNITFLSEMHLKQDGYPKTPDALLPCPIAIYHNDKWQVICWFESKALFGDDEVHEEYVRNQLWPYVNRFGPGAVIYWYGHIKDVRGVEEGQDNIIVLDGLPEGRIIKIQSDDFYFDDCIRKLHYTKQQHFQCLHQ